MMISITLPSLYREVLMGCLDNLLWTARGKLEIIVVSPFRAAGTNIVWVEEHEHRGIAAAHAEAFKRASGDFVFAWADDHLMEDGWDNALLSEFAVMESNTRALFLSLGLRHVAPHNHIQTIFGRYYPCFPCMRRSDVHSVGGWLSADYLAGFADADLGLRVWAYGGQCAWTNARCIRPTQANVGRRLSPEREQQWHEDVKRIRRRHDPASLGWPEHASGFNHSLDPAAAPRLVGDNTIHCPDAREFLEEIARAGALQQTK